MGFPNIHIADGYSDGLSYIFGNIGVNGNTIWGRGGVPEATALFAAWWIDRSKLVGAPLSVPGVAMVPYVQIGTRHWSASWGRWVIDPVNEVNESTYSDGTGDAVSDFAQNAGDGTAVNNLCVGPFPEDLCTTYPAPYGVQAIGNAQYEGDSHLDTDLAPPEYVYDASPFSIIAGAQLPPGETFATAGGRVTGIVVNVYAFDGSVLSNGSTGTINAVNYTANQWHNQRYTGGGAYFDYVGIWDTSGVHFGPAQAPYYGGPAGTYQLGYSGFGDTLPAFTGTDYGLMAQAYCVYDNGDGTTTDGDIATTVYLGTSPTVNQPLAVTILDSSEPATYTTADAAGTAFGAETLYEPKLTIEWSGSLDPGVVSYEVTVTEERPAREERQYTPYYVTIPYVTPSGLLWLYSTATAPAQQVGLVIPVAGGTFATQISVPPLTVVNVWVREVYEDGTFGPAVKQTYTLTDYGPIAPTTSYTVNKGAYYTGEDNL